jgi:hypothetical protein
MAKLGRYSADRKKIETLTAATKTVSVGDCGTIFIITNGSTSQTINLPKLSAAGKGWWCKFIYNSGTGDVTIVQSTSDTANSVHGTVLSCESAVPTVNLPAQISSADGVKFDVSACTKGDQWELMTDGSTWFVQGLSSGSLGLLKHDA